MCAMKKIYNLLIDNAMRCLYCVMIASNMVIYILITLIFHEELTLYARVFHHAQYAAENVKALSTKKFTLRVLSWK